MQEIVHTQVNIFPKREESGEWKMAREPFVKMATVLLTMLPGLVTAAV